MIGYQTSVNGKEMRIGVAYFPNRKKPCLVIGDSHSITKFATFNNALAARAFMDLFADYLGVQRIYWTDDENVTWGLLNDSELDRFVEDLKGGETK